MAATVGILNGQTIPHKALKTRTIVSEDIQKFLAFCDAVNRGQIG